MSRGSLVGPVLLLTGMVAFSNIASCVDTLSKIDHTITEEANREHREAERWYTGFPREQMDKLMLSSGQNLAYFIDRNVINYYRR